MLHNHIKIFTEVVNLDVSDINFIEFFSINENSSQVDRLNHLLKLLFEKNPTEDIKFLFKKASLFTGDIKHTCMQGVNILYAYFKMQKSDKLDPEIEQFELNI